MTGGGANVWAKEDNMQFVWKKASGDITLAADVAFDKATQGAIEHRKAMLMIRQSLDPNSAYADASLHGNGMTALQWRDAPNEISYEIHANADAPRRLRIEKRGSYFSMSICSSERPNTSERVPFEARRKNSSCTSRSRASSKPVWKLRP